MRNNTLIVAAVVLALLALTGCKKKKKQPPPPELSVRLIDAGAAPQSLIDFMGLPLRNPVGLAAGLDKGACCIEALSAFGFGHLELGTVTPKPQPGNPRPRLFRVPEHQAIVNRMGFNSDGIRPFLENVAKTKRRASQPRDGRFSQVADTGEHELDEILDDFAADIWQQWSLK